MGQVKYLILEKERMEPELFYTSIRWFLTYLAHLCLFFVVQWIFIHKNICKSLNFDMTSLWNTHDVERAMNREDYGTGNVSQDYETGATRSLRSRIRVCFGLHVKLQVSSCITLFMEQGINNILVFDIFRGRCNPLVVASHYGGDQQQETSQPSQSFSEGGKRAQRGI